MLLSSNYLLWCPPVIHFGPLVFLLYINDLNNVSTLVELILFADDTNLFMSHKDPVYLADSLNSELNKLSTWFKANKLSLNLKKTNFMLFKPRQKRQGSKLATNWSHMRLDFWLWA